GRPCISLDVTTEAREVQVWLYGDRPEAPLVDRAGANASMRAAPPDSVRSRQPVHGRAEMTDVQRPHYEVPMIRHHTVGKQRQSVGCYRLGRHTDECAMVVRRVKEPRTNASAIDDMKEPARLPLARETCHASARGKSGARR